jgi:uncharacterized membrane protein
MVSALYSSFGGGGVALFYGGVKSSLVAASAWQHWGLRMDLLCKLLSRWVYNRRRSSKSSLLLLQQETMRFMKILQKPIIFMVRVESQLCFDWQVRR